MVGKLGIFDRAEGLDGVPNVETLQGFDKWTRVAVLEFPCDMAHQHQFKVHDIRHPDTQGGGGFVGSDFGFHKLWCCVRH